MKELGWFFPISFQSTKTFALQRFYVAHANEDWIHAKNQRVGIFFLVNRGMGMVSTKVVGPDPEAVENKRRNAVLQSGGIKSELLETDARRRH